MKKTLVTAALATVSAQFALQAGEPSKDLIDSAALARESPWKFGVGPTAIFGAEVGFSGLGGGSSPNPAPQLNGTRDREYDDGFNRVDATGNTGNLTSYWSYQRASQYDPSGGGSISMSIYDGRADGSASDEATGWGGEIFACREIAPLDIPRLPGATWGWRLGFSVNKFSFEDDSTLSTSVDVLTDRYGLGGAVPPAAPFTGSPTGFGNAILDDQPSRTFSTRTAATSGSRDLDAVLFNFSTGPYLDIPVAPKFTLRLDGGLSLSIAHGDYSFDSVTRIKGVGTRQSKGSETEGDLLPGFYAGVAGIYEITPRIDVCGSVRYQYLDDYEVEAGRSRASIDFTSACMVSLGAIYKF